ncbi:DUF6090 family protein [Maribacter antarcticus]|uniref:DUF6090 family protein n=1 Tax=Maribacter antarcticus TaxID=505250 RepID=UPI00047C4F2C|nr:DUF6090 family protein [Maribacter antarcticus]
MIKFFRRVRQKIRTENKFSKYLMYAIGEVGLMVLGVLFALTSNKRNEENKSIKEEQVILKQLKTDYKANLLQL